MIHSLEMFRQFVNLSTKGSSARKTQPKEFFLFGEFNLDEGRSENGSLCLAVTDGSSAWLARVKDEDFWKLVATCRIGSGSQEDFVEQTRKAFEEPTGGMSSSQEDATIYVIEAQLSANQETLDLKWKLKETGLSQIIGQVTLSAAPNQQLIIDRILSGVLANNRLVEKECARMVREIDETRKATVKLRELIDSASIRHQLIERCTEVLNDAKAKNTAGGASSKNFEKTWETIASQSLETLDLKGSSTSDSVVAD